MTGPARRGSRRGTIVALLLLLALPGCMTPAPDADGIVNPDPFERTNRWVFAFNEGLDKVLIGPIGKGWRFISPRFVRRSIAMALNNLEFPIRAVSCLGQGRFKHAGIETGRFAVNTTVGILGLWDPATVWLEWPTFDEDTGQMFGVWGIGEGPYWVLPFFGPSNPRDMTGLALDSLMNLSPSYYGFVIGVVNGRAIADPTIERARDFSLDYYLFVREAYQERRDFQVADQKALRAGTLPGTQYQWVKVGDEEIVESLYDLDDSIFDEPGDLFEDPRGPPDASPTEPGSADGVDPEPQATEEEATTP